MLEKILKTKFSNIILIVFIISSTTIIHHYNSKKIIFKQAFSGYGLNEYVLKKTDNNFYKKDFPNGIMGYDKSLATLSYYYIFNFFKIKPDMYIYIHLFLQTLLFTLSISLLFYTLFKDSIYVIIATSIILVSEISALNLSRYGAFNYLDFPLFYSYANAFRFFALTSFINKKYLYFYILIIISMLMHLTMGLFMLGFCISYLIIFNRKKIINKSFIVGSIFFLFFVLIYKLTMLNDVNLGNNSIDLNTWIKTTKIFCLHWYPITMKLFTIHNYIFKNLLFILILFILSINENIYKQEKHKIIISGCLFSLIVTIFGIFASEYSYIPVFIKLSFQRISYFIAFFGCVYIGYFLYKNIQYSEEKKIHIIWISVYCFICLFFSNIEIIIFPFLLLIYFDKNIEKSFITYKLFNFKFINYIKLFILILTALFILILYKFNITKIIHFYAFVLSTILIIILVSLKKIINKQFSFSSYLSYLFIFLILAITIGIKYKYDDVKWFKNYGNLSKYYLDLQLWVKNNTPIDALFMPEPSHNYGWREYSERSSFGTYREWGWSNIVYYTDVYWYIEGKKRLEEFGINIDNITYDDIKNNKTLSYSTNIRDEIRKNYYSMSTKRLEEITNKYAIDYIIMRKKYMEEFKSNVGLDIVYENKEYTLYKAK